MTVGKKISIAFALLVLFSITIGVVSLVLTSRMYRYQDAVVNDAMPAIYQSAKAESIAKELRSKMLMHIASKNKSEMAGFESEMAPLLEQFKAILREHEKSIYRAEDRAAFSKMGPAFDRFWAAWEPVRVVSQTGKTDKAFAIYQSGVLPPLADLQAAINDVIDVNKRYADTLTAQSAEAASQAKWWITVLLGFFIAAGSGCGFFILKNISSALRLFVAEFREGTVQISTASSQVANSSQSLAQGASEQAQSLEETSASAEEITSMTRKNAENSRSAAELMGAVDQHVKNGNRTLEQMVVSMDEINASSDKISKIIKVIDEIAFQTNILALNAAVEAARAGEAGMGFAVVADEVRNLAQRSAQAAKDTAGLIEESIAKSNEGSTRLQQVSEVIRSITDSAAKVKTLVDEVNLGSQEQARGVDEISRAITQMSQVTQNTAAHAEESASASEELSAQASAMNDVVVRLRALVESGGDRNSEGRVAVKKTVAPAKRLATGKNGLAALSSAVMKHSPKPATKLVGVGKSAIPLEDEFTEI